MASRIPLRARLSDVQADRARRRLDDELLARAARSAPGGADRFSRIAFGSMTVEDAQLEELLAERDIRRVIFRYARGVDRRDWELVASCYHADAFESHGSFGRGPVAAFIEWAREKLEQYVSSTHLIGNVLIEVDGERASAESYCLGIHRRAGREFNDGERPHDAVANVRYIDRFERRDGVWRISERVCMFDPGRVDVVETDYPIAELAVRGVAGSEDASYDVLP